MIVWHHSLNITQGRTSQTMAWCSVRTSRIEGVATKTFNEVFGHLIAHGMTPDELYDAVCKQVSMSFV